jgi:hypothetical protein
MITRDITNTYWVHGFNSKVLNSTAEDVVADMIETGVATASGYGNALAGFNGVIIDRLGLPSQFNSAVVIAEGQFEPDMSSTGILGKEGLHFNYVALSVGLEHNCATSSGWLPYATGMWSSEHAAFMKSACSTHQGLLTTATSTGVGLQMSTSTGTGYVTVAQPFDLTGAKRYIRMAVCPRIYASDCGTHNGITVVGGILFGQGQDGPPNESKIGRIVVTSGCSTST